MQDPIESQSASQQSVAQLSSSVEHLRIREELRDCALCSGVGVIYDKIYDLWESMKGYLSSAGYKIITNFPLCHHHTNLFTTIAQSIAYPKPPAAAESSDSPLFVIAVFVSGMAGARGSKHSLDTRYGQLDIVDDIIKPFLPQSAPHLLHIPKFFFISADGDPRKSTSPPHFPGDPDGNYCVVYHVAKELECMLTWKNIVDQVFHLGMSVQEVIENSRSYMYLHGDYNKEHLHYFNCLKNKLVVKSS